MINVFANCSRGRSGKGWEVYALQLDALLDYILKLLICYAVPRAALGIWYPDTETVEGTREAMRRPRGRRVLRALPMVASGPLNPVVLGRRR